MYVQVILQTIRLLCPEVYKFDSAFNLSQTRGCSLSYPIPIKTAGQKLRSGPGIADSVVKSGGGVASLTVSLWNVHQGGGGGGTLNPKP